MKPRIRVSNVNSKVEYKHACEGECSLSDALIGYDYIFNSVSKTENGYIGSCPFLAREYFRQNSNKHYPAAYISDCEKLENEIFKGKQSPSKDRLTFILAAIAVVGLWVIGLGLWVLARHLN